MVATRDISALELILTEKAAAVGPKLSHPAVCVSCLAEVDNEARGPVCPQCGLPLCSARCEGGEGGFSLHTRQECRILARARPPLSREDFQSDSGVLASLTALRLLVARQADPGLQFRTELLMDNLDQIGLSDDWSLQEKCAEFLTRRCGLNTFTVPEVHRALGIFASNSCSLAGYRGRGLFPTFSLINHSCVRNARHIVSSEERMMEVVAQTDIKAGQEINVRYTAGCLEDFQERQDQILAGWYFSCGCERCSDPSDCSTHSSAVVCPVCRLGLVLPRSGQLWSCESPDCGQEFLPGHVRKVTNKLRLLLEKTPSKDPEKLENFLKIASKFLHPNHCLVVEVKKTLLALYGSTLSPDLIARKLELADEILAVLDRLEPGLSAVRGQILYDITRFRLMSSLQAVQAGQISPRDCAVRLAEAVADLETTVAAVTGEQFVAGGPGLKQRIVRLAQVSLLGQGYKLLLQTTLKMPFIK